MGNSLHDNFLHSNREQQKTSRLLTRPTNNKTRAGSSLAAHRGAAVPSAPLRKTEPQNSVTHPAQSLIYNFTVSVLEQIKLKKTSEIFSSSLIRKYIQEGKIEKVNLCLGRNWSMGGTVVPGEKRATKMNFPTANIIPSNLIHPKNGVYIIKAIYEGIYFNGIANFGVRPTVDGEKLLLEVHLFNFNSNLYGKDLTVEFLTFIRDEKKFNNFDELVIQIRKDVNIAKDYHLKK